MAGDLSTRRWRDYRAALLPLLGTTCTICGQPVDKTLPGTHRDGPTLDHRVPRSRGGSTYQRSNVGLAHQRCNASKRNDPHQRNQSRDW